MKSQLTILIAFSLLVTAVRCQNAKSTNRFSPSSPQPQQSDTELIGYPTYSTGSCSGSVGCIKGFIGHGQKFTLSPDPAGTGTDLDVLGRKINLQTFEFKDAQDFGDRFDTAFVKPLVQNEQLDRYRFRVSPVVTIENFASGFELYAEGLKASDDKVTMPSQGNFQIGNVAPYPNAKLRAIKVFRVETTIVDGSNDPAPAPLRPVTCLQVTARLEGLPVTAGAVLKVGGLTSFTFYYSEGESHC